MEDEELKFDRDGIAVLRRAFDPAGMADSLWAHLERRYGIRRGDPSSWRPGPFGKATKFGKSGPFASVGTEAVHNAIAGVLGSTWHERERWGAPLITFPTGSSWTIPRTNWHIDLPAATSTDIVRMFAFVSSVRPAGGGTLMVAGSHLLAARRAGMSSSRMRADLSGASPWFRDLWGPDEDPDRTVRCLGGSRVEGVRVRVVELAGEAGDVVLWHPSVLHTIAPNSLDEPRFMLSHTAYRGNRS